MKKLIILFMCAYSFSADLIYSPLKNLNYDKNLAAIGKYLYFDINLSPDKISCNSCHDLKLSGSGTNQSGINTDDLPNPPTVLNIALSNLFFIDGSVTNLYDQVKHVLKLDMNLTKEEFNKRAKNNQQYKKLFKKYGYKANYDNLVLALVEFEKSLITLNAPFDLYIAGDKNAISDKAKKGFKAFIKYGCSSCHNGNNFGTNIIAKINTSFSPLCEENSQGLVKVPTLRNITLTAPYTYKGAYKTLNDIIRSMSACQLGIVMPDDDVDNIIEFLKTLEGKKPQILDEK